MVDRQVGVTTLSQVQLSEGDLRAFRAAFRDWLNHNAEALEAGGEGKVEDLAHRASVWAELLGLWPMR
jgi:hypothetical protein